MNTIRLQNSYLSPRWTMHVKKDSLLGKTQFFFLVPAAGFTCPSASWPLSLADYFYHSLGLHPRVTSSLQETPNGIPSLQFPMILQSGFPRANSFPLSRETYHSVLFTASPKPGVSTMVKRSFTPFSSMSTTCLVISTVWTIRSSPRDRKRRIREGVFAKFQINWNVNYARIRSLMECLSTRNKDSYFHFLSIV